MNNCYLALTDPKDVARVESRTFISSTNQLDTVPTPKHGFSSSPAESNLPHMSSSPLGNWMSPEDCQKELDKRLPGCMKGRTMYVIPYAMGIPSSNNDDVLISKIGIELTDSPYVVCSMRIMTKMGLKVLKTFKDESYFVKCLHSVGVPLPTDRILVNNWPCNPENTMIAHLIEKNEVISYGSGYGGNSLLGKKCFALRLGSKIGHREGWLAEHMLILGLTNPEGKKFYVTGAFPSQCGKTNLAMITPSLPGWKAEVVGDDIAWLKFDKDGVLRAINPENGFFGVCPGTSEKTNPVALESIQYNTIYTNVAHTLDGRVYWEGLDDSLVSKGQHLISWKGEDWTKDSKEPAAHPNSRFCSPCEQCPNIDPNWKNPAGVPISAIIFGGRRPAGPPLVYEAFDWNHGVFIGSSVKSEATSAAEHKGKKIMHDPFAMRPFFGYNFGDYLKHWLNMNQPGRKMPRIFHVNWFLKSQKNSYLWPGYGENIRVLKWILDRVENKPDISIETPIGYIPKLESLYLNGLNLTRDDLNALFKIDKQFWLDEANEIKDFFDEYVTDSTPDEIYKQIKDLKHRFNNSK